MTQQDYEKAKAACWDAFWKENFKGHPVPPTMSIGEVFDYAFAKGNEVGKQMKATEDTVISGWVARDREIDTKLFSSDLFLGFEKPTRIEEWGKWADMGDYIELDTSLFPDLTWSDDPIEVEIIIKKKKKNL